jgi:hypothetical protein
MSCCDGFGYLFAWKRDKVERVPWMFKCPACKRAREAVQAPVWGADPSKEYILMERFKNRTEAFVEPEKPKAPEPPKPPELEPIKKDRRTLSAADFDDEYTGRRDEDL